MGEKGENYENYRREFYRAIDKNTFASEEDYIIKDIEEIDLIKELDIKIRQWLFRTSNINNSDKIQTLSTTLHAISCNIYYIKRYKKVYNSKIRGEEVLWNIILILKIIKSLL